MDFDKHLTTLKLSVSSSRERTALETLISECSDAFGKALRSTPIPPELLERGPTPDDVEAARQLAVYHAHRLGLSLSYLKLLIGDTWLGNLEEPRRIQGKGESKLILPTLKHKLTDRLPRNRPKRTS